MDNIKDLKDRVINKASSDASKILIEAFDICELDEFIKSDIITFNGRKFTLEFKKK